MQVEIKIDSSYAEPKVIILTAAVTEDVNTVCLLYKSPSPRD